jgi:Zn-dependent protease
VSGRDDQRSRDDQQGRLSTGPGATPHTATPSPLTFSRRELRDLLLAWVALSVAFGIFFFGGGNLLLTAITEGALGPLILLFALSAVTAGVGFLLHELGHKVVAVRFGQQAEFRADYGMLFLALASALAGFLFAAPGAVYHSGRITKRQHGLVALAGPVVNLGLALLFLPLWLGGGALGSPLVAEVGSLGLAVNLLLAAFNMIPFGPLDGKTIRSWSTVVWAAVFVPSAAAGVWALTSLNFL